MPDRPSRNRRKEVGEVKKAEKLSKMGIAMTCSVCKSSKHNKKGCPLKPKASSVHNSTQATTTSTNESLDTQAPAAPSKRKYSAPPTSTTGTSKRKNPTNLPRPKSTKQFDVSQQSSIASTRKGDVDTQEGGNITNFKRLRIVGQGVFVSESGYSYFNVCLAAE